MARVSVPSESPQPQRVSGRVTRSQSREPTIVEPPPRTRWIPRQLTPLSEDSNPDGDVGVNEDDLEPDDAVSDDGSESVVSASQRVRDESFSQSEIKEHDPDDMESKFGLLNAQTDDFLGRLKPQGQTEEEITELLCHVTNEGSRQRKLLNASWTDLERTQQVFGLNLLYPDRVLRGLLRLDKSQALPKLTQPWRPDDVIYKSNLANFVYYVLTESPASPFTETWEVVFPNPLLTGFGSANDLRAGESSLINSTFSLALALRTQYAIWQFSEQTHADREAIESQLGDIMLRNDRDGELSLDETLQFNGVARGWPLLPSPQDYLDGRYAGAIIQRTKEIRDLLLNDEAVQSDAGHDHVNLSTGVARLMERFPWSTFQLQVLMWANRRLGEIDRRIARLGGINEIKKGLEREIAIRLENPNQIYNEESDEEGPLPKVTAQPEHVSSNATPAPTSTGRKRPARFGDLLRGRPSTFNTAVSSALPSRQQVQAAVRSTAAEKQPEAETRPLSPGRSNMAARAHARLQQQQKKSIMDSQPDGVRLDFDEEDLPSQPGPALRQPFPSGRPKLSAKPVSSAPIAEELQEDEDVEDPSSDGGFQNDTRNLPPARRPQPRSSVSRAMDSTQLTASPSRRRRISSEQEQEGSSPAKRQRKNPGQTVELLGPSTGFSRADAAAQSRLRAKMMARQLPKAQRTRKPWTPQEEDALLQYIEQFASEGSVPYAQIKNQDRQTQMIAADQEEDDLLYRNILADREAEDLRFKARLLKKDVLIAGDEMPPGLEFVLLGRKEIDQVRRYDPTYEQERVRMHEPDLSP